VRTPRPHQRAAIGRQRLFPCARSRAVPSSAKVIWIAWWACAPTASSTLPTQRLPPSQRTMCPAATRRRPRCESARPVMPDRLSRTHRAR
jgi:hypothetical protein